MTLPPSQGSFDACEQNDTSFLSSRNDQADCSTRSPVCTFRIVLLRYKGWGGFSGLFSELANRVVFEGVGSYFLDTALVVGWTCVKGRCVFISGGFRRDTWANVERELWPYTGVGNNSLRRFGKEYFYYCDKWTFLPLCLEILWVIQGSQGNWN